MQRVFKERFRATSSRQGERSGPNPPNSTFKATPKQVELVDAIVSGQFNYIGFGGGIRGTKTWGSLAAIIILCKIFPGSRWAVVRKDLPVLRRNTIPSFYKLRDLASGFVGEINQSIWTAPCANGSEIIFFPEGLQQDSDLERWKGLEVNGFLLEESSELAEKSLYKAIERAGSWIIPDTDNQPPPLVLCTFNPSDGWVKQKFYLPWMNKTIAKPWLFIPTTILDNPYASDAYKESLKNLPPDEYKRFVEGDWNVSNDPNQLIPMQWIFNAQALDYSDIDIYGKVKVAADIARYGDDSTIFARVVGNGLNAIRPVEKLSTDRTADRLIQFAYDPSYPVSNASDIRIDGLGLGAGTVDYARRKGFAVTEIIMGAKPVRRPGAFFRFNNLRSQMYWEFREKLRKSEFPMPENIPQLLVGDLTSIKYEIKADKMIAVESKDDVKKRIGRSPDYGDAVAIAAMDLPNLVPSPLPPSISKRNLRR